MSAPSTTTTRGIILRTFPLREADLIVAVLSEDEGKIRAVAKGARKSKKRFLGGLDLFDCGRFEISESGGGDKLRTLYGFERGLTLTPLREDFRMLGLGSLMLELTDHLAHDGDPTAGELLAPLIAALRELCATNDAPKTAAAIRYFLAALRVAGVDPLANPIALSAPQREIAAAVAQAPQRSSAAALRPVLRALIGYAQETVGKRLVSAGALDEDRRPPR